MCVIIDIDYDSLCACTVGGVTSWVRLVDWGSLWSDFYVNHAAGNSLHCPDSLVIFSTDCIGIHVIMCSIIFRIFRYEGMGILTMYCQILVILKLPHFYCSCWRKIFHNETRTNSFLCLLRCCCIQYKPNSKIDQPIPVSQEGHQFMLFYIDLDIYLSVVGRAVLLIVFQWKRNAIPTVYCHCNYCSWVVRPCLTYLVIICSQHDNFLLQISESFYPFRIPDNSHERDTLVPWWHNWRSKHSSDVPYIVRRVGGHRGP